ncbi:uncharacterized protein LOC119286615 [Triticum dicoccoides]|uniref:uncharacterized protein LOC119286615 n=1 Tax=Triticum dicoccoides TaxID=85692 RepID=UPI00188F06C2|nr:uncharacterized protein LOC119286615 [Triticum dicoccoides]
MSGTNRKMHAHGFGKLGVIDDRYGSWWTPPRMWRPRVGGASFKKRFRVYHALRVRIARDIMSRYSKLLYHTMGSELAIDIGTSPYLRASLSGLFLLFGSRKFQLARVYSRGIYVIRCCDHEKKYAVQRGSSCILLCGML